MYSERLETFTLFGPKFSILPTLFSIGPKIKRVFSDLTLLEVSRLKARVDKPYPFPYQLIKEYSPPPDHPGTFYMCATLHSLACALSTFREKIPIPHCRKI